MKDLRINIKCECCGKVFEVPRTEEIPDNIEALACNFCFECDMNDKMTDYYDEWYILKEELPVSVDPNQLTLFN